MKKGFTLLEVLVASLLMGMLVTILTMVFNSSSIAWRTGKAGIVELNKTRRAIAVAGKLADDALPYVRNQPGNREFGMTAGAWRFKNGSLRRRSLLVQSGGDAENAEQNRVKWFDNQSRARGALQAQSDSERYAWRSVSGMGAQNNSVRAYTVGVWSYGPDRQPNTPDDIDTWPEDM